VRRVEGVVEEGIGGKRKGEGGGRGKGGRRGRERWREGVSEGEGKGEEKKGGGVKRVVKWGGKE